MEDLNNIIKRTAFNKFKISSLRPFQELIIYKIMEKENVNILSVLPTGGGKSLCFLLPSLLKEGITIIVYPLLSLMHDQADKLKKLNISYSLLEGSLSSKNKRIEISKLENKISNILITNIEMLCIPWIQEKLKNLVISLFVADEAHTIVLWGENFRPSYLDIGKIADIIKPSSFLAFTATTDPAITDKINNYFFLGKQVEVIAASSDRLNIFYHSKNVLSPRSEIVNIIAKSEYLPCIVFCRSRKETEILNTIYNSKFNCRNYHAGLTKDIRKEREEWFYNSNDGILFATCAYGMGVDKKNIRSVIHIALPDNALDFLQESGRGGRDMKKAHSFTFISPFEKSPLKTCFTNNKCIRENLLISLEQELNEVCSGCSVCNEDNISEAIGYNYILRKIRFLPLFYTKTSFKSRLKQLRRKKNSPLFYFSEKEIYESITYLVREKNIISIFGRLILNYSKKNDKFL